MGLPKSGFRDAQRRILVSAVYTWCLVTGHSPSHGLSYQIVCHPLDGQQSRFSKLVPSLGQSLPAIPSPRHEHFPAGDFSLCPLCSTPTRGAIAPHPVWNSKSPSFVLRAVLEIVGTNGQELDQHQCLWIQGQDWELPLNLLWIPLCTVFYSLTGDSPGWFKRVTFS